MVAGRKFLVPVPDPVLPLPFLRPGFFQVHSKERRYRDTPGGIPRPVVFCVPGYRAVPCGAGNPVYPAILKSLTGSAAVFFGNLHMP